MSHRTTRIEEEKERGLVGRNYGLKIEVSIIRRKEERKKAFSPRGSGEQQHQHEDAAGSVAVLRNPARSTLYFCIPGVFEILKNQERIAEKSREYESRRRLWDEENFPEETCAPLTQTRVKKDDMCRDGTRLNAARRGGEKGEGKGRNGEGVEKPNVRRRLKRG